jgi:hypothetical protein
VSYIEERPSGVESMIQNMASLYAKVHQARKKLLLRVQHEKAQECHSSWLAFEN